MNTCLKTFIVMLCFFAETAVAGPPVTHIKQAFISVVQGKQIYGNGKMQSVVRVTVELMPGVTWDKNVSLLEFGTGKDIVNLGWVVSDIDNGYDHNISSLRSMDRVASDDKYLFIDKYISTENKNEQVEICFEIDTLKHAQTLTYSTCYKIGIERGTVQLHAQRPDLYYASDFEFTHQQTIFLVKTEKSTQEKPEYDIKGAIYGLRPKPYLPRTLSFKLLNTEKVIVIDNTTKTKLLDNSENSVVRKYNFKNKDDKKSIGYYHSYLYKITGVDGFFHDKRFKFVYINYDGTGSKKEEFVFTAGDENIVNIFSVTYFRNTFMYQKSRCYDPDEKEKIYKCIENDPSQTALVHKDVNKSDLDPFLLDEVFYTFEIEDNYGNRYKLLWNPYPIN